MVTSKLQILFGESAPQGEYPDPGNQDFFRLQRLLGESAPQGEYPDPENQDFFRPLQKSYRFFRPLLNQVTFLPFQVSF